MWEEYKVEERKEKKKRKENGDFRKGKDCEMDSRQ